MISVLLPIHLIFVGIWLGCVITEALFERALLGKGRAQELILVELHKKVDLVVEIPAFVAVVVTGLLLYQASSPSALIYIKIILGVVAVLTNIYCVVLVFQRASAANRGDWQKFESLDSKQHQYGTVVLVSMLLALVIGVYQFGS